MGHKLIQTPTQMFGRGILIRIDGTSLRLVVAQDLTWSPDAVLTDTVSRLRRDIDEMKAESDICRRRVSGIHYANPDR